jgi:hypothetical protein
VADLLPEREHESDSGPPGLSNASVRLWPRISGLGRWAFQDRRSGDTTLVQFPNVPLWIFLGTIVLRAVVPAGTAARATLDGLGLITLAWWAVDELVRGVNPWRRLLGVAGCALVVMGLVTLLS